MSHGDESLGRESPFPLTPDQFRDKNKHDAAAAVSVPFSLEVVDIPTTLPSPETGFHLKSAGGWKLPSILFRLAAETQIASRLSVAAVTLRELRLITEPLCSVGGRSPALPKPTSPPSLPSQQTFLPQQPGRKLVVLKEFLSPAATRTADSSGGGAEPN